LQVRRNKINKKSRGILPMCKMHHPKADVDRLLVKRKGGGRGLLQIEVTCKAEIIIVAEYLYTKHKEYQFANNC
jgi:hypothetical protein